MPCKHISHNTSNTFHGLVISVDEGKDPRWQCDVFQINFLSTLFLSTNPASRCPWETKSWQVCICRRGGEKWRGDEWGERAPESVPDPPAKRQEWLKKGYNVQDWLTKGKMLMGKEGIGGTVQEQRACEVDGPVISIGFVSRWMGCNWISEGNSSMLTNNNNERSPCTVTLLRQVMSCGIRLLHRIP